ncbi:hypothetical protein JCM3775_005822 [Rhodotorula graminis]|uniref:Kinetochore protein Sos7 coiled-coil domain-containing protein n=1 Tax=Rhodotorula graminis (strain WP1) TaxID=578459 RepID=A0A194S7B9_RHOGW|nr:uncharacterized protein RHOBADRAFT_53303 [Rhodotorula graminis WP1]KPV75311.1 hypothetical protein RHOBADRAFT_53303 [Rhodotorula graminis WP1]
MAATDSSAALFDRTNALLSTYHQQTLASTKLVEGVQVRGRAQQGQQQGQHGQQGQAHTDNVTRWTQRGDATGQINEAGLVVDAMDQQRIDEDLKVFKDHVSMLKFAYLESNAKLEFINHILAPDGHKPISKEANDEVAKKRTEAKAALKQHKERAAELEVLIRAEAEQVEQEANRRNAEAEHAARLLRECEAMETEIAMLKNKRTATERLTVDEAAAICDRQELELVEIGQQTKQCEDAMRALKPRIKASKINIERYAQTAKQLRREQDERDAKGVQDVRAEEGCEWLDTTAALYKSLLGIHNAYAVGSPASELVFEYGAPDAEPSEVRRMSVQLDAKTGRMTGAKLLDSSEDIGDIVDAYLASQDIRALVQEIRTRFGW